jgi:hypothetical protein
VHTNEQTGNAQQSQAVTLVRAIAIAIQISLHTVMNMSILSHDMWAMTRSYKEYHSIKTYAGGTVITRLTSERGNAGTTRPTPRHQGSRRPAHYGRPPMGGGNPHGGGGRLPMMRSG